jgi:hypothetical protein
LIGVRANLPEEEFWISLQDIDGDGFTDLLVRAEMPYGPYPPVDIYFYDAEAREFEPMGHRFNSAPTLTATRGCVVTEYQITSAGMFADRECFNKQEKKWQTEGTCQLGDDGCPDKLKH